MAPTPRTRAKTALALPKPSEGFEDAFLGGGAPTRQPGGGPAGRAPLVRTLRAKQPEMRRVASAWHSRFERDPDAAIAEVVSLILVVADVPTHAEIAREDVQDRDPSDVVQQLVASLALEASEKGADFSQHWLVSHERGAQRVRENFPVLWKELVASASTSSLLKGLFARLRDWTLALSECQFRSIRHVATVAALHLAEGLWSQCSSLSELCGAVSARSGDDVAALLSEEQREANTALKSLSATRDALGLALLSRRTKDVDSEIRRECFEALRAWLVWDKSSFLDPQWSRYLHFGLCDREPKVRASVLSAVEMLLKDDPTTSATAVREFVDQIRPRLLPRCHDVEPGVAAAAIRCVSAVASRSLLNEEDFDPVVDLVWHPEAQRSLEATTFVCRFVFSENILDYESLATATLLPTGNAVMARRRISMLLHFLAEYSEGHFHLIDRLVASLWRRSSALEDWESIASMILPGGDHSLVEHEHVALLHLAESILRHAALLASGRLAPGSSGKVGNSNSNSNSGPGEEEALRAPAVGHAEAVMDRAWRALGGRLPALFAASKAQPEAMRRAASLCRFLLAHGSRKRRQQITALGAGPGLAAVQGQATAEALKEAFVRQPDPDTLEYLAESFAHLLDLSSEARPILLNLVNFFLEKLMKLIDLVTGEDAAMLSQQDVPATEALLAIATRLRILAKAVDVSLGQVKSFFTATLGLLDDRAEAIAAGEAPVAGPLLAVTLLELLVIVLMRHVTALLQPSPLPHCVMHDPVNQEELQITPTAARDFCKVATALLDTDPAPFVRAAAFAGSLGLLSAWANAVRFTEASREGEASNESPWLPLEDSLASSLCNHLAAVLMQANAVPPDCGNAVAALLSSTPRSSPFSLTFDAILKALPSAVVNRSAEGMTADAALSDGDRVKLAVLAGSMVASCHHPDVADSNLPAVVLTQAYSNREDLQKVAWELLSRLRKDAHAHPESGSAFFKVMMHAVHMLHRDAGVQVASDLSTRLLQRTCVGKLIPGLQMALMAALQAGIRSAVSTSTSPGFLEALVPWVTKHIMDDVLLLELAAWTEVEAPSFVPEGTQDAPGYLESAGVPAFVEACRATAARGTKTQNLGRGQAQKQLAQGELESTGKVGKSLGQEPAQSTATSKKRAAATAMGAEAGAEGDGEAEVDVEGVAVTEEELTMTEALDPTASAPTERGETSQRGPVPGSRQTPKRAAATVEATPAGPSRPAAPVPSRSLSVSQSTKRRRVSSSAAPSQSVRRQPVGPARTFGPNFSQS